MNYWVEFNQGKRLRRRRGGCGGRQPPAFLNSNINCFDIMFHHYVK